MRLMTVILVCLVASCTSVPTSLIDLPELPIVDSSLVGEPIKVHSLSQIFSLTAEQQNEFRDKYKSQKYRSLAPRKRIFEYLQKHLNNFNFHSDTLTASEVLSQNLGNCLSLAILTKSLVDMTNISIKYELVETPSVFQKEGGMLLSSQHVRTVLWDTDVDEIGNTAFFRNKVIIDYFPSRGTRTLRNVRENEFYSMFYSNKAAEALMKSDPQLAFWYLKEALNLKQDSAQSINMMGVVHEKLGYIDYAEKLYLYGLKYGNEKMELLTNYHDLLIEQKRYGEATTISEQLERFDDLNPFKWVNLADAAYNVKNYSSAIRYYKKAAKMADYLHEPYAGIARSQYLLGNIKQARRAIKKALKNSHKKETTSLYQNKYELFLKELKNN